MKHRVMRIVECIVACMGAIFFASVQHSALLRILRIPLT